MEYLGSFVAHGPFNVRLCGAWGALTTPPKPTVRLATDEGGIEYTVLKADGATPKRWLTWELRHLPDSPVYTSWAFADHAKHRSCVSTYKKSRSFGISQKISCSFSIHGNLLAPSHHQPLHQALLEHAPSSCISGGPWNGRRSWYRPLPPFNEGGRDVHTKDILSQMVMEKSRLVF